MDYKSIRQTVHMSRSTETPETVAEREYRQRLNGWSTFRSGMVADAVGRARAEELDEAA